MPKQPRGKRVGSDDHEFAVVSKNSNGDGSVYFEPGRTEKDGRVRKGKWRATYRDAAGKTRRVTAPTRVQAEVRRSEKLAEIEDAPKVGSRFSRDTTVDELIEWWLDSVARHQTPTSSTMHRRPSIPTNTDPMDRPTNGQRLAPWPPLSYDSPLR